MSRRHAIKLGAAVGLSSVAAGSALSKVYKSSTGNRLPGRMIWSTVDIGSSGYLEASAIADAFLKRYGTQVRMPPAGSAAVRIKRLKQGRALFGVLASEVYFASRGQYEFSSRDWGPQDLRTLMGRAATVGMIATKESGIKTFEDIRGRRVAYGAGSPSTNIKIDAMLFSAGLTRNDVKVVEFPSFKDAVRGLINGLADCTGAAPANPQVYELANSNRGVTWLELDPNKPEIFAAMNKIMPVFSPYAEKNGAGIEAHSAVNLTTYRYPSVTVYADTDPEIVYAMIKSIDECYPDFKDAAPVMKRWRLEQACQPAMEAPFHDGAIRYLIERGIWTKEAQRWNDSQIAQLKRLQETWAALAADKTMSDQDFQRAWAKSRDKILATS